MTRDPKKYCLLHFYDRVRTRIGGHVDPRMLADLIITEMDRGCVSPALTFITRLDGKGNARRVWRITIDGENHFIIFDHKLNVPVTVLLPTWSIKRARGARTRHLHLENYR